MSDLSPAIDRHADRERYALWAPQARRVELRLERADAVRVHELTRSSDGWFELEDPRPQPDDLYAFRLDGDGLWLPDPRSLHQPGGVHGPSRWVDPDTLRDRSGWTGADVRDRVLYELHIGTFTPGPDGRGGTFDSAIDRLDDLVDLGIGAVEVMPVAAFPGDRGWGYDGVGLFSVHDAYGGPEAFARFVTAAHQRGLAVILDVVHNHLGPSGNYLGLIGPYFTTAHETPWGPAVNLDQDGSDQVRAFLLASVRQWLVERGLDGLRLDAVHELRDDSPRHLLAEMSDAVATWSQEVSRPLRLIAESDRNDPRTVTPTTEGGLGMDMQWADDIHHAVHAWISGERAGYYVDFGSTRVLKRTLTRMFEHDGSFSTFRDRLWGAPVDPASSLYDAHSFVAFLQDHDQVGNRAAGDRVHHRLPAGAHAAGAALILLGAATPMLFMGEEWAASTPFTYFTDHDEDLGPFITRGRIEEFAAMGWSDPVPDPQAASTFTASILRWEEREDPEHAAMLDWYRTLLRLRHEVPALRDPALGRVRVEARNEETVLLHRDAADGAETGITVLAHRGDGTVRAPEGEVLARFGGGSGHELDGPGAVVVRR
ncbi:malto-oligosyltrehalose trehalohydrolase [Brachybacterium sp. EF45031]|uniref:malto-oligosyltrehalose trehalohydrolase n=1 Tax=Brachybacterium sillae TaxID=2810536 RepID=UPI00217D1E69|nr:malto-oligosyltrehalose trehalohydrolase [Brachybacterium sillae]MCS6712711.1 malto-oligosyltrehalose trehalohydrolase [Brachybacterium sillae]